MQLLQLEQRSDEWFKVRRGIPTASSFDKIITTSGGKSSQSDGYMYSLVAERITGIKESYMSPAMLEGIEREDESRLVYEMLRETEVEQVGFCLHDSERFGCSPDGLVGDDGLVEFKNPKPHTHVEYLVKQDLPTKYVQQVQGQLLVTGRNWCDFISYCPGLPTLMVRVERDEAFIAKLEASLEAFCDRLDAVYAGLLKRIKQLRGE